MKRFKYQTMRKIYWKVGVLYCLPTNGKSILRSLKAWSHLDFVNDKEAEQFSVIIKRPAYL
jgi:hypothetical protein